MSIGDEKTRRYPFYHKQKPIYALALDGTNGTYVDVPHADTNTITISLAALINPSLTSGDQRVIIHKSGVYYFQITPGGNLEVYFYATTNPGYHIMSTTIPLDKWTHVAVTYDGANVLLYKNGISESFVDTGTMVANSTSVEVGTDGGSSRNFIGLMKNNSIFKNVILTPTQVSNLSNGTIISTDIPGCMMYHDYTMGNATDWSGNDNHGTLQGNAHFTPADQKNYYRKGR